ncbi:unnamed protein product [Symbiodinium natans]|uniref:Uncharacterized protein n=1 Tax=Symbiodinium natans TaxID=878477 RepID=A0A812KLW4_9DINO|nr:unnamed protein product [Symbiodinium natans]
MKDLTQDRTAGMMMLLAASARVAAICLGAPAIAGGFAGDVKHLEAAFSKDVQELGYLSPDCVLLELDLACKLRQTHPHRFLNDARNPEVGNFFKGLNKELYTVEAVLQTAFAMQPLLTISDLEAAVLKMCAPAHTVVGNDWLKRCAMPT